MKPYNNVRFAFFASHDAIYILQEGVVAKYICPEYLLKAIFTFNIYLASIQTILPLFNLWVYT